MLSSFSYAVAQNDQKPDPNFAFLVEVIFAKGGPISLQKVGQEAIYYGYVRLPGWTPKTGDLPVDGVRVFPHLENGEVTVKISVYHGKFERSEETVAEYAVTERPTVFDELQNYGIWPFEVRLVRASQTVSSLPTIVNKTRSLVVTVEPNSSTVPSFKVKVLNSSAKPVYGFAFNTFSEGRIKLMGLPRGENGSILIEPGATYESKIRYPTKLVRESGGPPEPMPTAELQILSVVFADGSSEGEDAYIAPLRASQIGTKVQLTRILSLLRSEAATDPLALDSKIEKLSIAIDAAAVDPMLNGFKGLSASDQVFARGSAERAAADIHTDFKKTFTNGSFDSGEAFRDAVKSAIIKYEALMDSLP
jgi:hypothetical protein